MCEHKILQGDETGDRAKGKTSRVTRKHVIVGVTCAAVIAMVITGVLVGVKFHLDSTSEIVTVSSLQFVFAADGGVCGCTHCVYALNSISIFNIVMVVHRGTGSMLRSK